MGKLSDEIMGKLASKGGGESADTGDEEPDMADEGEGAEYGSDEEKAMQDFEDAASPAEKVSALKTFLEICYPQLASRGE
jgi:hypothetical protein